METLKRVLILSPNEYYDKHLAFISELLPQKLSPKERDILSKFMAFEGPLVEEDRFNTLVRKKVRKEANDTSAGNLSNYLDKLIKKGYLLKNKETKKITVHPKLWPNPFEQNYNITLAKDGSKTN